MVLLSKEHKKQSHFYRNVILALIVMITCLATFIFCLTLHSNDNPDCICPGCLINNARENEYLYNRYLPLISIFILILIILPIYVLQHRVQNITKKRKL